MTRLLVAAGLTAAAVLPETISGQSLPDSVLAVTSARLIDVVTGTVIPRGLVLVRSEEHTSELQSQSNLVCRLLLEKKNKNHTDTDAHGSTTSLSPSVPLTPPPPE